MKVLIIDNNEQSLGYFKHNFELRNVEISIAQNAKDAFEILDKTPHDVILSEIILPGINGPELCKIWNDKNRGRTRFLFFTNFEITEDDIQFVGKIGAISILKKDVPFDIFWQMFSDILSQEIPISSENGPTVLIKEIEEFYSKFLLRTRNTLFRQFRKINNITSNLNSITKDSNVNFYTNDELKEQLYKIFDDIPLMIIIHNEGKIIYANNEAIKSVKLNSVNDILGVEISKFVHPDEFLTIRERLVRLFEKKEQVEKKIEKLLTIDGNIIYAEVIAIPLDNFGPKTVLVIGKDVTEETRKKKFHDALNKAGTALLKALSSEEIFKIVSETLIQFGISTVFLQTDKQNENLILVEKKFASNKLELLEKFIVIPKSEIKIKLNSLPQIEQLKNGEPIFYKNLADPISKTIPDKFKSIENKILDLLEVSSSIVNPLFIENKFVGIMAFLSKELEETDINEFESFSNQFALALRNVQLIEKLMNENKIRKKNEKGFKTLTESAQIVIYVRSGNKAIYVNPYTCQITGYSKEEIMQMNFWDFICPEYREKVKKIGFARLNNVDVPKRYVFPILTKDKKTVWLDYSASVTEIDGEKIIIGTAIDVTRQIEIEKELKENKEQFETLVNTTSVAVFVYSGPKFVFVNNATSKITGYSKSELLNMNFWEIVHPDFREKVKERGLARQKGEELPREYEFKIIRKDGSERWILLTGGKILWHGKEAAIGTAIDIHDKKIFIGKLNDEIKK